MEGRPSVRGRHLCIGIAAICLFTMALAGLADAKRRPVTSSQRACLTRAIGAKATAAYVAGKRVPAKRRAKVKKCMVPRKSPAPPVPTPTPTPTPTPPPPLTPACAELDSNEAYLSEGPPNAEGRIYNVKSTGTLRAAVIFVDFADAPGSGDPRQIVDAWMRPGVEWMRTSSYGRLSVELQPATSWVRMPRTAASYGYARGLTHEIHQAYVADAIASTDPTFDFAQADVVFVVAPSTDLISFSPTLRERAGAFTADGRSLGPAVTFGRDAYSFGRTILPHETSHLFGLPDLYAYADGQHGYVGTWDYMGNVFQPTDLFAWHRLKFGWLEGGQVACAPTGAATSADLEPLGTPGGTKAVFVRTGPATGLLVENRQRVGNDSAICRTGALVYTVDSAIATGLGPIKVVGGTPAGCGHGPQSDAPLGPGARVDVGGVVVEVVGYKGSALSVRVTVP